MIPGIPPDGAELLLLALVIAVGLLAIRLGTRLAAERERHRAALAEHAYRDPLTGLANRAKLTRELDPDTGAEPGGVLLLVDLDGFKAVNDTLGHGAGDHLLTIVGERIHAIVPRCAVAARLGGDEFAVLLPAAATLPEAVAVAERVLAALSGPITLDGMDAILGASIGIAFAVPGAESGELLRDADIALYAAKAAGRAGYRVFEPGMHAGTLARVQLETDLAHALIRDEFEIAYQPIVELPDGRITGFEALLRWRHPTRGLLMPANRITALLDTGAPCTPYPADRVAA